MERRYEISLPWVEGLGIEGACLLKGQGTQATGKVSKMITNTH